MRRRSELRDGESNYEVIEGFATKKGEEKTEGNWMTHRQTSDDTGMEGNKG